MSAAPGRERCAAHPPAAPLRPPPCWGRRRRRGRMPGATMVAVIAGEEPAQQQLLKCRKKRGTKHQNFRPATGEKYKKKSTKENGTMLSKSIQPFNAPHVRNASVTGVYHLGADAADNAIAAAAALPDAFVAATAPASGGNAVFGMRTAAAASYRLRSKKYVRAFRRRGVNRRPTNPSAPSSFPALPDFFTCANIQASPYLLTGVCRTSLPASVSALPVFSMCSAATHTSRNGGLSKSQAGCLLLP
eukprot:GHVT01083033.1.p1 GENE.GHVT01083033.1~~GHVT01083033.1.p1  ORF type:complete len:246 (-),score=54.57 GHVT01083033.1:428-1165(-)